MDNITNHGEGSLRERLAADFLTFPPMAEQTPAQRREYRKRLAELGRLERRELQSSCNGRPLVWGNAAALLQSFLSAAQRLAAGLGQPLLLFPAKDAAIGSDTLLHPRVLTVTMAAILADACIAAPRRPVWVRLQEQREALAITITAETPFATADTLAITKECTRLHDGGLVHCDNTLIFTCGQQAVPPPGVRLYGCPTEEDLLQDTLSPVWSGFYATIYSAVSSSATGLNSKSAEATSTASAASLSSTSERESS